MKLGKNIALIEDFQISTILADETHVKVRASVITNIIRDITMRLRNETILYNFRRL